MTNEEAKEIMSKVTFYWELGEQTLTQNQINEAIDMAIKALEQQPCEDVISRDELLKAIDTWDKFGCDANTKLVPHQDHYIPYIHYDDVIKCIKGMPPVTSQPKIGHWINLEETKYKGQVLPFWSRYGCSKCGGYGEGTSNYCPNCGADMRESEDKE